MQHCFRGVDTRSPDRCPCPEKPTGGRTSPRPGCVRRREAGGWPPSPGHWGGSPLGEEPTRCSPPPRPPSSSMCERRPKKGSLLGTGRVEVWVRQESLGRGEAM